jgi:hypothetical protein
MRQVTDRASWARARGKAATAARTVWMIEVGALRFRCLHYKTEFEVQLRHNGKWECVRLTKDPAGALRAAVTAPLLTEHLAQLTKKPGPP